MIWAEKKNKKAKTNEQDSIVIAAVAIMSCLLTAFLFLFFSGDLRKEVVELRAEHEAIEEHYCPYCGTYLGGKNENDD